MSEESIDKTIAERIPNEGDMPPEMCKIALKILLVTRRSEIVQCFMDLVKLEGVDNEAKAKSFMSCVQTAVANPSLVLMQRINRTKLEPKYGFDHENSSIQKALNITDEDKEKLIEELEIVAVDGNSGTATILVFQRVFDLNIPDIIKACVFEHYYSCFTHQHGHEKCDSKVGRLPRG